MKREITEKLVEWNKNLSGRSYAPPIMKTCFTGAGKNGAAVPKQII